MEEILFRGLIFKGLYEQLGRARAYLFAALFYSAIHFVKPGDSAALGGLDAWTGARYLANSFQPFTELQTLFPGLLGLYLIGAVLCYAFERTGTLYLPSASRRLDFSPNAARLRRFSQGRSRLAVRSTDPKIAAAWLPAGDSSGRHRGRPDHAPARAPLSRSARSSSGLIFSATRSAIIL
jgi:hypothetical protein